jgi:hypothetical protein
MKTNLILKSLADLPAGTIAFAISAPGRAVGLTRRILAPSMKATRRQIRAARHRSAARMQDIYRRANTPLRLVQPWAHGGLNE